MTTDDDDTDQDSTGVEAPRPHLPVWQKLVFLLGALIAVGGLGSEVLNYGRLAEVPRALVAVIIGGIALMSFPILIKVPGMIRMWRRL